MRKYRDLLSGNISQQEENKFIETYVISKFKEQIKKEENLLILKCQKLKEGGKSRPDFKCVMDNGEVIFVEVTTLTIGKNNAYKRIEWLLREELEKMGFKNIDILINLDYNAPAKLEKNIRYVFAQIFAEFLNICMKNKEKELAKGIYIKNEEIKRCIQQLQEIQQPQKRRLLKNLEAIDSMVIRKHWNLSVMMNRWIHDPEHLHIDIEKAIKKKERKAYKETPLWLLIYIDDILANRETIKDILESKLTRGSKAKFERIYILLDYCPETSGFPLFKITL